MSENNGGFEAQSEEQEKQYAREARLQYDPEIVKESHNRWNSYTKSQQQFIKEDGSRIYSEIVAQIEAGKQATHPDVQSILVEWHEHLRYFYEPTLAILEGLGQLYNTSPDFMANFQKMHPDLPAFLETAITHYVDELETAELERMLAEDENTNERASRLSSD